MCKTRVDVARPVQARLALWGWSVAEEALGPSAFAWRDDASHPLHGRRGEFDERLGLPERLSVTAP